jgi:hypothetical protein
MLCCGIMQDLSYFELSGVEIVFLETGDVCLNFFYHVAYLFILASV